MNAFGKILSCLAMVLFAALPSFALDWGIELSNEAGIDRADDTQWYTDNQAALWITAPLDRTNTNSIAIEGRLYGAREAESGDFTTYLNLELCRLSFVPVASEGERIAIDAGRIRTADITGYILNQAIDGAELHGSFAFGNIDALVGYTGLLNARKTGALMSQDDYIDATTDDLYALGAKRLVGKVTVQLPELVGKFDLIAEATGQYDLRDALGSDYLQLIHTAYGTLSLSGPLAPRVYLTASGVWQTGVLSADKDYSENAYLALARLDWFAGRKTKLFAEVLYTSATNDFFSAFLPITFQSAGELFTDGYGNLFKAQVGGLWNPVAIVNVDLSCRAFMYPKEVYEGDGIYQGTEFFGGISFLVRSDLRLRCEGAAYLPKDEDPRYQASLKAVFDL
jgi:hypothetical protein